MSVSELKERHAAATETVNNLRDRLRQRRLQLLDTDGLLFLFFFAILRSVFFFISFGIEFWAVAKYSAAQGRSPVKFGATDLVCCRTLQGHTGKVKWSYLLSYK